MRKRIGLICLILTFAACMAFTACSSSSASDSSAGSASEASSSAASDASADNTAAAVGSQLGLAAGEYEVDVATDSSMFHLNETAKGKGTLTVADDGATVHITLVSKKIVNLYAGTAEQAEADEAGWIQPTTDTVTYDDGITEEVYGFDIPVPVLDEPFKVSILGAKGKWYDHTVTVSSPVSEK